MPFTLPVTSWVTVLISVCLPKRVEDGFKGTIISRVSRFDHHWSKQDIPPIKLI